MKFMILLLLITPAALRAQPIEPPDTLWFHYYPGSEDYVFNHIYETYDGGYLTSGTHFAGPDTFNIYTNLMVLKTDSLGDPEWLFDYPEGSQQNYIEERDLILTADSGCIALSNHRTNFGQISNIHLLKLDTAGVVVWEREYDLNDFDYAEDIELTEDGGYVISGHTDIDDSAPIFENRAFLLRVNAAGDSLWSVVMESDWDTGAQCVVQLLDGNFMVSGRAYLGGGPCSIFLAKVSAAGQVLRQSTLGSSGWDYPIGMLSTAEGCIMLANIDFDEMGLTDRWLVALDMEGDTSWAQPLIASAPDDFIWGFTRDRDGGWLLSGWRFDIPEIGSCGVVLKLNQRGTTVWESEIKYMDGRGEVHAGVHFVQPTRDGNYIATVGTGNATWGEYRGCLVKLGRELDPPSAADEAAVPLVFELAQNYPNPFNPETEIRYTLPQTTEARLAVYDVLGREVAVLASGLQAAGTHTAKFNGRGHAGGVYFCRLDAGGRTFVRKMLMLK